MPKLCFISNMSELIRDGELDGRSYKVAPVVLIVEGVHNELFYPATELAKFPEAWNAKPVPVYHPTDLEGNAISATSPEQIQQNSIGLLFNVRWDAKTKKLRGEVWIDIEKAGKLEGGKAVLDMLEANQMIEVSTGLFVEIQAISGDWNGEHYDGIAITTVPITWPFFPA